MILVAIDGTKAIVTPFLVASGTLNTLLVECGQVAIYHVASKHKSMD